ncbi:hypothetical protein BA011_28995 (plasmid) [Rhizobium leguminosarum]|uniref:Alkyl sulfatase C-terminal domain-containing protein n=2 Tax=Rhizobium leguminosarum TaxID=384 RepID=A0A1B1CJT9_RHILE|nr:hypothetical protein BA011_28995 [Rhizobium leguminosarum]
MDAQAKFRQGTVAWFEMVGTLMCEAASDAGLTLDVNLTLVERYTDGVELAGGHVQSIRFAIINGQPSFRIGVRRDERGDVTIEITASAARALNVLRSGDPDYQTALQDFQSSGEMKVGGDPSRFGRWLETVHDLIVERTI